MTGPAATSCRVPRILFVGKRFYTNKDALLEQFGRMYWLPFGWARSGVDLLLWLIDYHTRSRVQAKIPFRILSTPLLSFSMLQGLYAALRFRPTVIVASGDSYIGLLGWMLAKLLGARFVFDVYDKYDEFDGYRNFFGWDSFAFLRRKADLKTFCSVALQQAYACEGSGGGSVLVANGVDQTQFRPLDRSECRAAVGLETAGSLLGYFGSMEPDRGVADLIGAVELLRFRGLDLRVLICGKEHPATKLDRDWIIYRGAVPHADMPLYLGAADVLVVPYRQSPIMDMGASCKIAEYLMCGRPIVSTRTGNSVNNLPLQASALKEGLCDAADPVDMARAIQHQLRTPILVPAPENMKWSSIASDALQAIVALEREVESPC